MRCKITLICKVIFLIACLTGNINFADAQDYQWAKSFGGQGYDGANAMTIDAGGNVYTTGVFQDTVDFDPGTGTYNINAVGFDNVFVSKLYSNGNFAWAVRIGGSISEIAYDIKVDAAGYIYTTGYLEGTADFDPGPGTYNLTSNNGSDDIFVSKLNPSGGFVWARKMGGNNSEYPSALTVDASGNVLTTGYFFGTGDFDPGAGVHNLSSTGQRDIFISKLNSAGNFLWAKKIGGSSGEDGNAITTDPAGNVYTTGNFSDTVDFNPGGGTFDLIATNPGFMFVSKLTSAGNFVWAKSIGDSGSVHSRAIVLDTIGNIYIAGSFSGRADFDPGPGVYTLSAMSYFDIFILKLDHSGDFIWVKRINSAFAGSLALDSAGNVYTSGAYSGPSDFDPGAAVYNLSGEGAFISKLDANGNFVWAKGMTSTGSAGGNGISIDAGGNIYIGGAFLDSVDFNPPFQANLYSNGYSDMFVAKYNQPTGCAAAFTVFADTIPHNWIALNQSTGAAPLSYLWSWGDSSVSTGAAPSHIYNTPGYYNICLNITDANGCVSTYCDSSTYLYKGAGANTMVTINVVSTNIFSPVANENKLRIYPNPARSNFTIDFGKQTSYAEIIIYNVFGQEINKKIVKDIETLNFNIEGRDGIYFVKINSVAENSIIKIVKQ